MTNTAMRNKNGASNAAKIRKIRISGNRKHRPLIISYNVTGSICSTDELSFLTTSMLL